MSRIKALIETIEAGEPVDDESLRRTALLQSLDVARTGEQFVDEWIQREEETDVDLRTA